MKKDNPQKILAIAVFALSYLICEPSCSADSAKSAPTIESQISEAENHWKAGRTTEYYSIADIIVEEITEKSNKNNLSVAAVKLFESIISKGTAPKEVAGDDLKVMAKLESYLISKENISGKGDVSNAKMLCKYLGKIRKEIIPNYKWQKVYMNRAGWGNTETIKEPAAKARHEAVGLENDERNRMNSRQRALRKAEWEISDDVKDYIVNTFSDNNTALSDFTDCVENAKLKPQEKEELLKKVSAQRSEK